MAGKAKKAPADSLASFQMTHEQLDEAERERQRRARIWSLDDWEMKNFQRQRFNDFVSRLVEQLELPSFCKAISCKGMDERERIAAAALYAAHYAPARFKDLPNPEQKTLVNRFRMNDVSPDDWLLINERMEKWLNDAMTRKMMGPNTDKLV